MNGYNYNSNSNFAVGTPLDEYGQPDFTKSQVLLPQPQHGQHTEAKLSVPPEEIAVPPRQVSPTLPSGHPVPVLNRGKNQAIALKIEIEVEINFKVRYDQ